MNRTETKCADLHRYTTKAAAQAKAEKLTAETNLRHIGYPCECMGWHVERIDPIPPTPNQLAVAQLVEACGNDHKLLNVVLHMRKQEMDKYRRAHVPKRRVAVA